MNFHGGDIYRYNKNLIDFSSNINPLGVPESFKKALMENINDFTKYPDIEYKGLIHNLSEHLNVNQSYIVAGNGAVDIIYKVIEALEFEQVYSIAPTFSEYRRGAERIGINYSDLHCYDEEFQLKDVSTLIAGIKKNSILVLCNPNNPTGTLIAKKQIRTLLDHMKDINSFLVMDEAFIEFTGDYKEHSCMDLIYEYDNLFIIRAATKFFGMPGLRLGYGISSNEAVLEKIKAFMEPWSINTAAVIASEVIFKDRDYIKSSIDWIKEEREAFKEKLGTIKGIKVYNSMANFFLIRSLNKSLDAFALKEKLIGKGFLIRVPKGFSNLTPYDFRIAIKDRESNRKLAEALRDIFYK